MKCSKLCAVLTMALAASAFAENGSNFAKNLNVNKNSGLSTTADKAQTAKHIYAAVEDKGDLAGKAAIYVYKPGSSADSANNDNVSFAKIDKTAGNFMVKTFAKGILGKDKNGVTVAQLYRMKGVLWDAIPNMPDHAGLGRLSYAQAGNLDVYFGDWADVPAGAKADSAGTNYTAFYSGTGKSTDLPTSGTATYAVKGINNHVKQNTAVLTGNLTADFGKRTLNGSMARQGLNIAVNNAKIDTAQASFNGAAVANGNVAGKVGGHFFGSKGAALAGVADFGKNHAYNTAFGGVKK